MRKIKTDEEILLKLYQEVDNLNQKLRNIWDGLVQLDFDDIQAHRYKELSHIFDIDDLKLRDGYDEFDEDDGYKYEIVNFDDEYKEFRIDKVNGIYARIDKYNHLSMFIAFDGLTASTRAALYALAKHSVGEYQFISAVNRLNGK